MSIRAMTLVWERSAAKGSPLLILLAIADCGDDEGLAWPAQRTLMQRSRLSERAVRGILKQLVADGELIIEKNHDRIVPPRARRAPRAFYQVTCVTPVADVPPGPIPGSLAARRAGKQPARPAGNKPARLAANTGKACRSNWQGLPNAYIRKDPLVDPLGNKSARTSRARPSRCRGPERKTTGELALSRRQWNCPHDPRCDTFSDCRDLILAEGRAERAAVS